MYNGLDLKRASRESGMRVILYFCACIYMHVARSARLAIHKLSYSQRSMGIVIETVRLCTRARQCIFIGYSGENAIPTNFQRVPPYPAWLYQLLAAIADKTKPRPGNITVLYICIAVRPERSEPRKLHADYCSCVCICMWLGPRSWQYINCLIHSFPWVLSLKRCVYV